jgi:SAM-dependent methyltransferase
MEQVLAYKKRNYIHERDSYEPKGPQEEFIVPLLKQAIADAVRNEAPAGGRAVGKRVLDIGCGKQPFRGLFEGQGYAYFGLDVQTHENTHIDFIAPIDQELPAELLSQGAYDFILCTEVLEHVANWHAAFGNFSRLLNNGGRILITCPHFYQLHEEPYDFWRPTNHAIEIFARNYGLRVVRVEKAGTAWDVLGTLLANSNFYINSTKITHRIFFRFFQLMLKKLSVSLKNREIQKIVAVHGPLYLSNVAVLEK